MKHRHCALLCCPVASASAAVFPTDVVIIWKCSVGSGHVTNVLQSLFSFDGPSKLELLDGLNMPHVGDVMVYEFVDVLMEVVKLDDENILWLLMQFGSSKEGRHS